jgi:ethanolamine transporter
MFATTLLACDMGGYPIAVQMALTPEAGQFSGIILGSMMGPTIVFSIPVCLSMVDKKDHGWLATGVLCGIVTIPFGCFIGGVVANFSMGMILSNLVPIIIVAALIAAGLLFIPSGMIRGFSIFGKFMVTLGTVGIISAIVEALTGISIIPGMAPVSEGISIVGSIVIVLAGAYPMVTIILKFFGKPLSKAGEKLGMNEKAAGGLVASLANSIPMLGYVNEMDPIGKVANFAFMVSGAFVFGDHLGFTAGVDKTMVLPLISGKLTGGILAVALAILVTKKRIAKMSLNE